ncbi:MAG: hypothetical protein KDA41_05630, partial [Planctomycetales bacterium]|nr:hypothetical protein [Planctomycetales bacterium]
NINGQGPTNNGTGVEGRPFNVGEPSDIVVHVRKSGIRVERDGGPFIDWKGAPDQLSLGPYWVDKAPPRLFVGVQARFAIHRLELAPANAGND